MKLPEHVKIIRELISTAFGNQFARLGVTAEKQRDTAGLDAVGQRARAKLDAIIASHIEETGSYAGAFEKALDEYTFTLFNRLAALKVMESHRMFPEVITKRPENGGRSFGHRAWLEQNPAMVSEELEGLLPYIRSAFDSLGREIRLYSQESTYDMLPYVLDLNTIIAAVNAVEEDKDVGTEIWCSDDVMGWLYESYNLSQKKAFDDSGEKIEFDKVSLKSQVYTPKWVVEFLVNNSLGKFYLEMHPDSEIKRKYTIANAPTTRVRPPKPLSEIRLIDPATGSGNFLLYAFDFFYALYLDQIENYGEDYEEDDIPKLIIENNLYGVDLDDRAIQIAQLGLYVKALRKNSRVHIEKFNVVSSDFYLPDFEVVADSFSGSLARDPHRKQLVKEIWADLQRAYKFGSLIRVEERFNAKKSSLFADQEFQVLEKFKGPFFQDLHNAVSAYSQKSGNSFLHSKTNDAITFLEILTQKFDVAVANPPYTDSGDFGGELKSFIEANYKKPYAFHTNLYATFIKRSLELTNDDGFFATIHPHTFMYIKSFEGVREYIINNSRIDLIVDYGLDRVNLFGPGILLDATFYVLSKKSSDKPGIYFNITANLQEKYKYEVFCKAFEDLANGQQNDRVYLLDQAKLKIIKSWPFIYWISDVFREKFSGKSVEDVMKNCQGLATANNNRFVRYFWEVGVNNIKTEQKQNPAKWVMYAKGGPYNKWYGNDWLCVNWENDGEEIRNYCNENGKQRSRPQNEGFYFLEGITYSASGSKGASYRLLPKMHLFDVGGSSIFPIGKYHNLHYIISFMNSKLSSYITGCLNPTVNIQVGDIQRIPFVVPKKEFESVISSLAKVAIDIKNHFCQFSFIEINYGATPLLFSSNNSDLRERLKSFFSYENHLLTQVLINEAIINEKIFEVYELTPEDKAMVLASKGESIGGLPVLAEARAAYLAESQTSAEFPLDNICEFIEALPSITQTEQEIADLSSKFETLYQNNNDLEEFCIRNHINPINVWFLFQKSGVLPSQRARTIAMEFLADLIREILNEDEDGIVPLVRNAGEEILLDRIEKKFEEKGLSTAHFSAFPSILGKEINEYITSNFFADFSDHLNLFMYLPKTPFIWHITSGLRQGFDAYIIIYKWNRDKLFTLKSVYIEKRETSLRNRQSDLINEKSAQAENEKDLIFHQLKEIDSLKKKIDELLAEGYDPKLDDGVGKNIAPLQKKGIIAYDVLNAGQLKKFLNADW
ncbi:MAG: BREX-1 system adenine-specific DNA-methyltransferase PglX [Desulfocapsaceae bacterium]|nr:BREX-1 system adenine-specific DNA-methyltransferase PglX [Desulfocapsaceae bacterium]